MASEITREMAIKEMARRELARRQASAPAAQEQAADIPPYNRGAFGAASEAASDVFGLGDEITAGVFAAGESAADWMRGKGFNYGDNYKRIYGDLDRMTQGREQAHPTASMLGNVAGDLAAAGGIAKGATMAGKGVIPAMIEGGTYGGVAGAGYAREGEKPQGALYGALTGAATGGAMEGIGGALASRATRRNALPAPTADDLAQSAQSLYRQSEQAGVSIRPKAMQHLTNNMKMAAGRLNANLRRNTAGVVDDLNQYANRNVSLQELDELRQQISGAMKRAEPQDVRTLERMKNQLDNFLDNVRPGDITGDKRGIEYLKEARELWRRKAKTELIDQYVDLADLQSGQFSQSGMQNALRVKFKQLETQLIKNKRDAANFSIDERRMIRQLADGKVSSSAIRWLAKFAPRGPVSFLAGLGSFGMGGPAGLALPGAGHLAAGQVDRAAVNAAQQLSENVARGAAVPMLPNRLAPFAPGVTAISGGQLPRL